MFKYGYNHQNNLWRSFHSIELDERLDESFIPNAKWPERSSEPNTTLVNDNGLQLPLEQIGNLQNKVITEC